MNQAIEIQAAFKKAWLKKGFTFNGRTIPDRMVLEFLDKEFNEISFTVDDVPSELLDGKSTFDSVLVGMLHYSIEPDTYNSKPGKVALRAVYGAFVAIEGWKLAKVGASAVKGAKPE